MKTKKDNTEMYRELMKILSKYDLDSDKKEQVNLVINKINKKDYDKYFEYINTFLEHNRDFTDKKLYHYINSKAHYDKAKDTFVNNFQYYMKLRDKTVMDASNDLYISYSTVNDWYNGRAYPRPDKIELLAKYLNIHTSDLTEERTTKVPVLGRIPAGIPNEAIEYIDDWEEIPASWSNSDKEYFALKISGTSMTPKYQDGDIVIFQRASRCDNR